MHIKVRLKIILCLLIFIIFISFNNIKLYALFIFFIFLHELSHIITIVCLNYKIEKIEITPFGLNLNFKINIDDYNKKIEKGTLITLKKILIYSAGPLTNLIIVIILLVIEIIKMKTILPNDLGIFMYKIETAININTIIFIFNMLPIYPLDGGRIIKEIIHLFYGTYESYKKIQDISLITLAIVTAITSIIILYYKNITLLIMLIYLWYIAIYYQKQISLKEKIYENIYKILNDEEKLKIKNCK